MNAYIYQADIYCGDCGAALCRTVPFPANANRDNETTWDSNEYPKGPFGDGGGEAGVPQHCGSGAGCLNAIIVRAQGKRYRIGVPLGNPLTAEGVEYVRQAINEPRGLCRRLWRKIYAEELSV